MEVRRYLAEGALAAAAVLLLATACSSQAPNAARNSPPPASTPAAGPSASISASPLKTQDCIVPYQGAVEFYDALIKAGGSSAAQLIMERGEGHYPDFNYPELESPVIKLLRVTIGPGVEEAENAGHD